MDHRRPVLLLSLAIGGCFSDAPDAASGSDDAATGDTTGHSLTASASGAQAHDSGTPASGTEDGDPPTSGNDAATSADDGGFTASDTATAAESTDGGEAESSGGRPVDPQPYGSPCRSNPDCESGLCLLGETLPEGMCTVTCDPLDGGCTARGHAAFCVEISIGFGCIGELETGSDGEDGLLRVGDRLSGSLDGGDRDAFYLELEQPGRYAVRAYPGAGLDIVVSTYESAEFRGYSNNAGIQGFEELRFTHNGDPASYPSYLVAVVSAASGTAGSYDVRFAQLFD